MSEKKICKAERCNEEVKTMGYCGRHYQQFKKYGEIISINQRTNRDPNEFIIEDNITRIVLYDRFGNVTVETIFDTDIIEYISKYKWYLANTNYVVSDYIEDGIRKQMSLHRAVMFIKNNFQDDFTNIDHKDTNTLNNLFTNLRSCTVNQNMMNSNKQKWCSSKWKGVFWNNHATKWQAQITFNGKKLKILDRFDNEIDAARAYNAAAIKYFGEFANLNDLSGKLTQKDMLYKIFEKQDELNEYTNGIDWKNMSIPWYRAIFVECSEMMNYLPWKWWKSGDENLEQLKLELIDILHFGVSKIFENEKLVDKQIDFIINAFQYYKIEEDCIEDQIEVLAKNTLKTKHFDIATFIKLAKKLNMTISEIYKLYMGKNILNGFRQDHGYKQQKYQKMWDGQEDNIYLMDIIKDLEVTENFREIVYSKLEEKYKQV